MNTSGSKSRAETALQTDGAVEVSWESVALQIELCKMSMEKLASFPTFALSLPLFIRIPQDGPVVFWKNFAF